MSLQVIAINLPGFQEALGQYAEPLMTKRALRATQKGANALKLPLQMAAWPLSRRMALSVYVHKEQRGALGYVLGHHRHTAFWWHMVIGGTRAHSLAPRSGSGRRRSYPTVRGVKPHPIVAQVQASHGSQAATAMLDDIAKSK